MGNNARVARLATLVKERFGVDLLRTHGPRGPFDVFVDGKKVVERAGNPVTRMFGAGYPAVEDIVSKIEANRHGT